MAGADSLEGRAQAIRAKIVRMAHAGRTPHVASALSCADVMTALYFNVLRVDPAAPQGEARDRFILSKGHGCMALYAVLAERGFFPEDVLEEYARDGGRLAEHPAPRCVPGIEVATGSLGHGLSLGAGLALAAKARPAPRERPCPSEPVAASTPGTQCGAGCSASRPPSRAYSASSASGKNPRSARTA